MGLKAIAGGQKPNARGKITNSTLEIHIFIEISIKMLRGFINANS